MNQNENNSDSCCNTVQFFKNSNTELLISDLNMTRFKVQICVELIHSLLTDPNKLNRI